MVRHAAKRGQVPSTVVTALTDLSDVSTAAVTDKFALMANGSAYVGRALVEADISDLGSYAAASHTHVEADITDLQDYLTAEINDLSDAVTWANVPDANITLSSIDQHIKWVNVSEDTSDVIDSQYIQGIYFKDGTGGITATLEGSGVTTFPAGSTCAIVNAHASTGDITITEGSGTTLYIMDGATVTDTAGGCTLGPGGYATLYRHSATVYYIMGAGLTA